MIYPSTAVTILLVITVQVDSDGQNFPQLQKLLKKDTVSFVDEVVDETSSIILNDALALHYYPNKAVIKELPLPGSNCSVMYLDHIFYLASIIGVIESPVDEFSCAAFCNLNPKCFSTNYLPDKRLCYLLASGLTMSDIQLSNFHSSIYNENLNSRHYIFSKCFDDNGKPVLKIPTAPVVLPLPSQLSGTCGVPTVQPVIVNPNARIVGGTTATPHSWPWIVSMKSFMMHFCGATIIRIVDDKDESDILLTAAHCVTDENGNPDTFSKFSATLGSQSQSISEEGAIQMAVEKFVVHPDYDHTVPMNDVAVVLLKRSVKFSRNILPVCLAKQNEMPTAGSVCVDIGWGNTIDVNADGGMPDLLQQLKVPTPDDAICSRPETWNSIFNHTAMICAGYLDGKRNVCTGDSGGPLLCKTNGKWTQYGVASFVAKEGCPAPNKPGVFARVSTYYPWIMETVGKLTKVGKKPIG